MKKKCLNCSKFLTCKDERRIKVVNHFCDSFKPITTKTKEIALTFDDAPEGLSFRKKGSDPEIQDVDLVEDLPDDFVWLAMQKAYDQDTNTVRDLRIDDSDMPLAKNFFDFCFSILKDDVRPPFARQMWLAYVLLSEYCPDCTKPKWYEDIENLPVDMDPWDLRKKVAFLEHGVCPYCAKTKSMFIEEGKLHDKTDLILLLGQRSGKSTISTLIAAYVTHHLVKAPKLSKLCSGIQDFTPLSSTFTATTANQAIKTLWNPFKKIIGSSTWFKNYFAMLDDYKEQNGKELYQFNPASGLYLRFFHKNLELYSSGPAKRTLRGDTRFFCIAEGSMVQTLDGQKRIEVLSTKDKIVIGNRSHRVSKTFDRGIKDCVTLVLTNGFSLKLTPDHKVLTLDKECHRLLWVEVQDLSTDDYVACSVPFRKKIKAALPSFDLSLVREDSMDYGHKRKLRWLERNGFFYLNDFRKGCGVAGAGSLTKELRTSGAVKRHPKVGNVPHQWEVVSISRLRSFFKTRFAKGKLRELRESIKLPKRMSLELARLSGYLLADGNYAMWGTSEVTFASTSKSKADDFYNCYVSCFGKSARRTNYKDKADDRKPMHSVLFSHNRVKSFLFDVLGFTPANASKKFIPELFFTCPEEIQYALLSTMISCDGSVPRLSKLSGYSGKRVSYSTTSARLANDVSLMLQRLGYAPKTKVSVSRKVGVTYLRGWRTEKARQGPKVTVNASVSLCPGDSQRFMLNFTGLDKNTRFEVVTDPREAAASYRPYILPNAYSLIEGRGGDTPVVLRHEGNHQKAKISETFKPMIDKGLVFSRVSSIFQAGVRRVYDITVDSTNHAFVSNGIVTHNCATDELSYFPFNVNELDDDGEEERERANADEVYQSLVNSLATVQSGIIEIRKKGVNHMPQAIFANISSPYSWLDKACRLYLENQDNPAAVAIKLPTWEISPMYAREHPIIVAAYRRNPKKAERDFGANPPRMGSDFYSKETVVKCFQVRNGFRLAYDATDSRYTKAKAVEVAAKDKYPPSVLALDAGVNNNAFALALVFREGADVTVETLVEIVPQPGTEIHYPSTYESIIKPIIKERNVKALVADRFNSLQVLQQARDDFPDLKATQYSVKLKDFHNVLNLVSTETLFFPELEMEPEKIEVVKNFKTELINSPASHLYLQCLTVQELGGTVIKGKGPGGVNYTDDLHRAVVLGIAAVTSEAVSKHLAKFKLLEKAPNKAESRVIVLGRFQGMMDLTRRR